VKLKGCRWFL